MDIEEEPKLVPEEEEEAYTFENLKVSIAIDQYSASLLSNVLEIRPDGFTFMREKAKDEWFTVYAAFRNTTSVGISGDLLMVFVGDQQVDEAQETPDIIKIIEESKQGGNACLMGYSFSISIDFGNQGKNVLKEVHDIFTNYMGDADDDRMSKYDEDQDFEQMISADDIDENGNIIDKNMESQDESEESQKQEEDPNHSTQD